MKLFHGSDVAVKMPKILENIRALDFGAGFYLTSNKEQAIKWSKIVAKRRKSKNSILNIYDLDESAFQDLSILRFEQANYNWLDFVVSNRKENINSKDHDLVIGPVANDTTISVIDNYIEGVYTKQEAVKRLLSENLTDQYAFFE